MIFEDASTADVILHLQQRQDSSSTLVDQDRSGYESDDLPRAAESGQSEARALHVHTQVLVQCRYFNALLSERWLERGQESTEDDNQKSKPIPINLSVGPGRSYESYVTTIQLLYSKDFMGVIVNVATALSILPIAAELLYDDCISACVRFLEAVPWSKEEERQIVQIVSLLQLEESSQLLARLSPVKVKFH